MIAAIRPETFVRPMQASDLSGVHRVERASYDYPWSQAVFRDCLLAGYYSIVLDVAGTVSGYAIMSMAASEAHVLNICVHPDYRRSGYGRRLLTTLIGEARDCGIRQIFLEVRPSNDAAISLYLSAGFEQIGIRPAYYQAKGGRENAVVFSLKLASSR